MSQPMRITFRYPDAKQMFLSSSERDAGGAPVQIYTIATELAKDPGLDVFVWVDGKFRKKKVDGITLLSGREPLLGYFQTVKRLFNKLRMMKVSRFAARGLTIFTVSTDSGTAKLIEQVLARGGKTAYRIASDYAITSVRDKADGSERFSNVLLRMDAIITQTNTQQRLLKESTGLDSLVIHSAFPASHQPVPAHKDRRYDVLWVGQCRWYKRPWIVIDLARQFPQVRFLIIMPEFDQEMAQALKPQIGSLSNIELLDYVAPSEIQHYYDQSRIVLNTSLFEGYPNTLNNAGQAQAAYLSLTWDADEIFAKDGVGLCSKDDINLCYEQLGHLIAHPEETELMGQRSFEYLQAEHNVEKVVKQYKDLVAGVQ